jgi:hypothetical protein
VTLTRILPLMPPFGGQSGPVADQGSGPTWFDVLFQDTEAATADVVDDQAVDAGVIEA